MPEAPHESHFTSPGTFSTPGTYNLLFVIGGPEAVFQGPGDFVVNVEAGLFADPKVTATGGADVTINTFAAALSNPQFIIDGASTLSFQVQYSAFEKTSVAFNGTGGKLVLPSGGVSYGDPLPAVTGFGPGDEINFGTSGIQPGETISYTPNSHGTGGTLTLTSAAGTLGAVNLTGSYDPSNFIVGKDGGIDCIPCFLAGTRILTPGGERAVESLAAGDEIVTLAGITAIKAVRSRTIPADLTASRKAMPVRIAAGALGGGLPRRDLLVSPDHAMFLDGGLVPAALLVNGGTITQAWDGSPIQYVHVEIEPHGVIYAEGAATESYLDIGLRSHFTRPGAVGLASGEQPKGWEDACAPLLLAGPRLAAIRGRLGGEEVLPQAA